MHRGEIVALRLCIDRLVPPRRDRPVSLDLPNIDSAKDAASTVSAMIRAVSVGDLTPLEASDVAGLLDAYESRRGASRCRVDYGPARSGHYLAALRHPAALASASRVSRPRRGGVRSDRASHRRLPRKRLTHLATVLGVVLNCRAAAALLRHFSTTLRTIASRPFGVRGAFLWLLIWSLRETLKLRNLSFFGSNQMDNLLKAQN